MTSENRPDMDVESDRSGTHGGPSRRAAAPGVEQGLKSQVWVVGLVGIVVILLALFSLVL